MGHRLTILIQVAVDLSTIATSGPRSRRLGGPKRISSLALYSFSVSHLSLYPTGQTENIHLIIQGFLTPVLYVGIRHHMRELLAHLCSPVVHQYLVCGIYAVSSSSFVTIAKLMECIQNLVTYILRQPKALLQCHPHPHSRIDI